MPSHGHGRILTSEQLALAEARKKKKAEAAALASASSSPGRPESFRSLILPRKFLSENTAVNTSPFDQAIVMSWNMLAQCLVRRELFPTSDCLRAHQREAMLFEEMTGPGADIICLQEVDRLERLGPILDSANYAFTYSSGPGKKHGCIIAYKKNVYDKVAERTVFYDDVEVRTDGTNERSRKGSSFRTKNIGLVVALKRCDAADQAVAVATTHLFWHPKYTYERARQALILLRSVCDFKETNNLQSAPSFIAGDFNFSPADAAYSLMVGDPLLPEQEADIEFSRVVHVSLDPSVPVDPKHVTEDEEGAEADPENDPDRIIKNARSANPDDGLLEPRELVEQFARLHPTVRSAYDHWGLNDNDRTFGARVTIPTGRRGRSEPIYTSYTHYWKLTLDYIFVVLPPDRDLKVLGILEPPLERDLGTGLPRKGVCGSDHLSVRAHIAWPLKSSNINSNI